MLTREQLLAAGPQRHEVTLMELGSVFVKELTSGELVEYVKLQQAEKSQEAIGHLLVAGVCDADGKRLFAIDDIAAIMNMGSVVTNKLIEEVLKASKMGETTAEKK